MLLLFVAQTYEVMCNKSFGLYGLAGGSATLFVCLLVVLIAIDYRETKWHLFVLVSKVFF